MPESATTPSLTDRMAATSSRITAVSRRLTAEAGLAGFTIEQLCAEVGISRRTFFNYFPSKEEAVIGLDESEEAERLATAFLARPARGWPAVVDDLVDIVVEHAREIGLDLAAHSDLIAAIEREPRLLARFIGITRDREQQIAELIAAREGSTTADPHVRAAVQIVAGAMRMTGERILDPASTGDFAGTLLDSIAAIRGVLAPTPEGPK
jgi:AcrR family transcriptional regulator